MSAEQRPEERNLRVAATAALAAIASALYLATMLPGAGWLDSSELVAGAHTLGVVHPPGHPVYVMLAKALGLLVPLGSIAFRIHALSAVLGVACALLVAGIVRQIADHLREPTWLHALLGATAGLAFAVTDACWLQSVRAEVYTLNTALVLAALDQAVRWYGDHRRTRIYVAAVLLGFGLGNHHYLVFFFAPAPLLLLLVVSAGRRALASLVPLRAAALVLVALLAYAYLPIRSNTDPEIDWGHPTTVERFVHMVTAKTFQGATMAENRGAPVHENLAVAIGMFTDQVRPVGLAVALTGLVVLLLRAPPIGVLLWATLLLNLLTRAIIPIDPTNPDDYGYFLTGIAVLAIGAGVLPALVRSPFTVPVGSALILAGAVFLASANYPRVDLRRERTAEAVTEVTLDRVAPSSVLFLSYFGVWFAHWQATLVEERRPDVARVQSTFDGSRYNGALYIAKLRRNYAFLEPLVAAFEERGVLSEEELRKLARTRPVYIEPMPESSPSSWGMEPAGMVRRIHGRPVDDATGLAADAAWWRAIRRRIDDELHPEGVKALAWHHYLHAITALRQGLARTAGQVLDRAERLSKDRAFARVRALTRGLAAFDDRARDASQAAAPFRRVERAVRRAFLRRLDYVALIAIP